MHRYFRILKRVSAVILCFSFVAASATTKPVQAELLTGDERVAYINRCENSIRDISTLNPRPKIIATAYLVGEDDVAAASWLHDPVTHECVAEEIYAVEPDTEIQGLRYKPDLYPQDNREYLIDIITNYGAFFHTNRLWNMPQGAQYIEWEGAKFQVVAADEEWVTVWDRGYQAWFKSEASSFGAAIMYECTNSAINAFMETHPAGFYRIPRNKVWIDFGLKENHPYQSEAEIPKAGSGVVTKLVNLRPVPNEEEKMYTPVYALPRGTKVNVVSTELVPSQAPGSKHTYYKVSFNGSDKVQNNTVHYLDYKVPGVYYVDSRYLNFTRKGTAAPGDSVPGEIINANKNESVYAYRAKDTNSERVGILSAGVEIAMFPAESDADWTTVYFSGQKAYVQTKYIKKAPYKITDISKLEIADIVDDEITVSWKEGVNNVEFSCSISTTTTHNKKGTVLWSDEHYKDTSFLISRKYIEKYSALDIKVQATDKNGNKGKALTKRIILPSRNRKPDKKRFKAGKTKITCKTPYSTLGASSMQYSTNKKFKKAVTVEKHYKKGKKDGYKMIQAIKKLKSNKTYYIRSRTKKKYSTAAGTKWLSGKWSKYVKIRTKRK
ncbi:MAG: hypothetical protein HFH14_02130 [Lachnospiraceae bacterium]|nr:hypothetical protein [Lachnospiraceae bacterium]